MPTPPPLAAPSITPVPAPASCRRVMLFGGTFDPPHRAHVALPALARGAVFPEGDAWLVYVPAARSPFKESGPVASDADRVAMLRLAIEGADRAAVWTDEIDRAGEGEATYTIDTVRRARAVLGAGVELRLLIGADQAGAFHRWREAREVVRLAEPVVMRREPQETEGELAAALRASGAWTEDEIRWWLGRVARVGCVDGSSSEVRAWVRAGEVERARGAVGDGVWGWIERRGLYRG